MKPELSNCYCCGNYGNLYGGICSNCDYKYRAIVKEYNKLHPYDDEKQVADALGVPAVLIKYYNDIKWIHLFTRQLKCAYIAAKGLQQEQKKSVGMSGKYHFLTPDKLREIRGLSGGTGRVSRFK